MYYRNHELSAADKATVVCTVVVEIATLYKVIIVVNLYI